MEDMVNEYVRESGDTSAINSPFQDGSGFDTESGTESFNIIIF